MMLTFFWLIGATTWLATGHPVIASFYLIIAIVFWVAALDRHPSDER